MTKVKKIVNAKKIIADFKTRTRICRLSKKYGFNRRQLMNILGDLYVETKISKDLIDNIKQDLKSGLSSNYISMKYKVKKYLVDILSVNFSRKMTGATLGNRSKAPPSKDKIIRSLQKADKLGIKTLKDYICFFSNLTRSEKRKYVSRYDLVRVYKSWNNARKAAGLYINTPKTPTRLLSLDELHKVKLEFLKYSEDSVSVVPSGVVFKKWIKNKYNFSFVVVRQSIHNYYGADMGMCEFLLRE